MTLITGLVILGVSIIGALVDFFIVADGWLFSEAAIVYVVTVAIGLVLVVFSQT